MALISNPNNFFCENHFVFIENKILLKCSDNLSALTKEDLPDENLLRKLMKEQLVCDWFTEKEYNYSAWFLEKDAPLPSGTLAINFRQFFWDAKDLLSGNENVFEKMVSLACRAHGLLLLRQTYRFCPACGKPLLDDEHFTAKKCSKCGSLLFPRIEPAIIVLVKKEDKILLAKNKNSVTGHYSCIAGFVEQGENLEQAVHREVYEETGLKIKNLRYAGSQAWPFPDQLMLAYYADWESGQIKIQEEELESAEWFSYENLPSPLSPPGSAAYNLIFNQFDK